MAVTNLYKAANSPVHSAPSIFSLRGIFSCCYGKGAVTTADGKDECDNAEHPLAGDESDDSDDGVRREFERLQGHDSVDLQADSGTLRSKSQQSHISTPPQSQSLAKSLQGSIFDSRATKSIVSQDGRSVVSQDGKSAVSQGSKSVFSKGSRSVVSQEGSLIGASVKEDDAASDSSEHLSDASSVTQYSEEYGDAPQGLTNLSDISDEDRKEGDVRPTGKVPTLGSLSIGVSYEGKKARLKIRVICANSIPDPSQGGTTSYQLHLVLLPERRQRHKTKVRSATRLTFEETFMFSRVSPSTVGEHALRLRLYGCERMRRERLVAETVIALTTFGLQSDEKLFDIPLEPRTKQKSRKFITELEPSTTSGSPSVSRTADLSAESSPATSIKRTGDSGSDSDSGMSLQGAIPHGNNLPELLLGLSYNGSTGRLTVEVIKGSAFRLDGLSRPPDSYVKMNLISSNGQEVSRSKTSVRRNDPNPLFKETFMFQMAMFQLMDLTLMIFVYHKKNISRKESIGWFSLGHNSSGDEEVTHWRDMKEALGDRVVRWHLLLEPS